MKQAVFLFALLATAAVLGSQLRETETTTPPGRG